MNVLPIKRPSNAPSKLHSPREQGVNQDQQVINTNANPPQLGEAKIVVPRLDSKLWVLNSKRLSKIGSMETTSEGLDEYTSRNFSEWNAGIMYPMFNHQF